MKELGKKRHEDIETIEAYDIWGCSGYVVCNCEGESYSHSTIDNELYKYMISHH